jgi:hypothetical protein
MEAADATAQDHQTIKRKGGPIRCYFGYRIWFHSRACRRIFGNALENTLLVSSSASLTPLLVNMFALRPIIQLKTMMRGCVGQPTAFFR